eukprot:gene32062-16595_t
MNPSVRDLYSQRKHCRKPLAQTQDLKHGKAHDGQVIAASSSLPPEATQNKATYLKDMPTISGLTALEPYILSPEATQSKAADLKDMPTISGLTSLKPSILPPEATQNKATDLKGMPTTSGLTTVEPSSLPSEATQNEATDLKGIPAICSMTTLEPSIRTPEATQSEATDLKGRPTISGLTTLEPSILPSEATQDKATNFSQPHEAPQDEASKFSQACEATKDKAGGLIVCPTAIGSANSEPMNKQNSAPHVKPLRASLPSLVDQPHGGALDKAKTQTLKLDDPVPNTLPSSAPNVSLPNLHPLAQRELQAKPPLKRARPLAPLSQQPPGSLVLSSQQPAGSCHTSVTHSATQTNKRRRTGDIAILSGGGPDVPAVPAPPGRPAVANILPDCPAPSFSSRPSYPVDPKETVGISAKETVGISAKETVGISAKETVGISAKETVGISPKETQVVSAEEAAPSVLTLELDVLFSNFTSKGYSVKGTASAAVAPGLDASSEQLLTPPEPPPSSASPETPSPLEDPSTSRSAPGLVSPPYSVEQLLIPPEPPTSSASAATPSPLEHPSTSKSAPDLVSPPPSGEQLLTPPEPPPSSASPETPSPLEHHVTSKSTSDLASPPHSVEQLLTPPKPPLSYASGQSLVTPPKRSDRTPSHVSVAPSLGSDCTPSHVSVAPSPGSDCTPSAASGSSPSHISRSAAQKPDPLPLALFPSPSPSPSRSRSPNKRTASQAPGPSESTHLDALSLLTSQDPLAILRQHRQQRMWAAMSKAARSPMHYDNHPSSADASRLPSKQSPPSAHHVLSPSKNMSPPSSHLKAGSSRSGPEAAQQFPPKLACKEIRESGCDGESSTNGMVDIARYLVTQPPGPYVTASYTLEQELRDSFINCQLANEWHNNNSPWARMDIAGLETGLTSYITQFNRLQACRKKITAYRGVTSVATLQQRLDKEWKHLKAIRVRSMESAAAQEGQCVNGEDRLPGRIAARAVASSARDGTVPANGCDTDGASEVVEASHVLSPSVGDCTREGEADDDKDARASEPASGDAIDTALSCEGGADANRDAGGCGLPVAENPRSILRNYEASISRRTIPVSKTVAFAPALELGAQSGYSMS